LTEKYIHEINVISLLAFVQQKEEQVFVSVHEIISVDWIKRYSPTTIEFENLNH